MDLIFLGRRHGRDTKPRVTAVLKDQQSLRKSGDLDLGCKWLNIVRDIPSCYG